MAINQTSNSNASAAGPKRRSSSRRFPLGVGLALSVVALGSLSIIGSPVSAAAIGNSYAPAAVNSPSTPSSPYSPASGVYGVDTSNTNTNNNKPAPATVATETRSGSTTRSATSTTAPAVTTPAANGTATNTSASPRPTNGTVTPTIPSNTTVVGSALEWNTKSNSTGASNSTLSFFQNFKEDPADTSKFPLYAPPTESQYDKWGKIITFISRTQQLNATNGRGDDVFVTKSDFALPVWSVLNNAFKERINGNRFVKNGTDIVNIGSNSCAMLPLQDSEKYAHLLLPFGLLQEDFNAIGFSSAPFLNRGNDMMGISLKTLLSFATNQTLDRVCLTFNKDMLAIGMDPPFPSPAAEAAAVVPKGFGTKAAAATSPFEMALKGIGLSWRGKGAMKYSPPNLQIWDGYKSPKDPNSALDQGNLWMSFTMGFMVPGCPTCKLSGDGSLFMGINTADKVYSAAVNMEQLRFGFGGMDFRVGNAFGVWRLNETISASGQDDICNPSGIFLHSEIDLGLSNIHPMVQSFLDFAVQPKTKTDIYSSFRPVDGFYGSGARYQMELNIMGVNVGKAQLEFQYVTTRDAARRRQYWGASNPCSITCAQRNDKGECVDGSVMRPADRYMMEERKGDIMLFYAHVATPLRFMKVQMVPLALREATFVFGISPQDAKDHYVFIDAKLTVLWIVDFDTAVSIVKGQASFEIDVDAKFVEFNIKGGSDVSLSQYAVSTGQQNLARRQSNAVKALTDNTWDLSANINVGPWLRAAVDWVKGAVNSIVEFTKKVWNGITDVVNKAVEEVKKFFSAGGPLAKFAGDVKDFFQQIGRGAKALIDVVGEEMRNFAKAGLEFLKTGNPAAILDGLKAVGNAIVGGIKAVWNSAFGTSHDRSVRDRPDRDSYGCVVHYTNVRSCKRFLFIKIKCSDNDQKDDWSDQECIKNIAVTAGKAQQMTEEANKKKVILEESREANPALVQVTAAEKVPQPEAFYKGGNSSFFINTGRQDQAAMLASYNMSLGLHLAQLNKNRVTRRDNNTDISKLIYTNGAAPLDFPFTLNLTRPLEDQMKAYQESLHARMVDHLQNGQKVSDEAKNIVDESLKVNLPPLQDIFSNTPNGTPAPKKRRDIPMRTFLSADYQVMSEPVKTYALPVIAPPDDMEAACAANATDIASEMGKPKILSVDPKCNDASKYNYYVKPLADKSNDCVLVKSYEWTFFDSCGQASAPVIQHLTIQEEPPIFTSFPADVTVSCSASKRPLDLPGGIPMAQPYCGLMTVDLTYEDSLPNTHDEPTTPCQSYTFTRKWIVTKGENGCSKKRERVQTITVTADSGFMRLNTTYAVDFPEDVYVKDVWKYIPEAEKYLPDAPAAPLSSLVDSNSVVEEGAKKKCTKKMGGGKGKRAEAPSRQLVRKVHRQFAKRSLEGASLARA
ncbi:hypothetical protein HDV05_008806 [Chytridiales sp. JEL 0842]|nr:hypothetical protein HDV05_008806 [Chytridiales sp. JEL 0842]